MNYLNEYAMFDSVKAMDEAIAEHIRRNRYELNETDRDVLMMLSRYSVKYKGAAHLKIDTIAAAIGKSGRTVQRVLRKLERLNIIERKEFIRKKSGGHGANIYVILPVDVAADMSDREDTDKPNDSNEEKADDQAETISLLSDKNKTLLETAKPKKPTEDEIIKRSLRNAIPAPIYDALSPFFSGRELYKIYGILLRAKAKINRFITLEEYYTEYIDAFYNAVRLRKAGRVHTSFDGLLYVSWQRVTSEISRKIAYINDENNTLRLFEAELLAEL